MNIYIIGCGGVGSWLAPAVCKLHDPKQVILVDGDTLERKNLDRQLFDESMIGESKAVALADRYGCKEESGWFSMGQLALESSDWLLVAVDNHPARLAALQECDSNGCRAVFAMNETWSSEACLYRREWRHTPMDFRTYCPEVLTDHSGDPLARGAGCTGEAQRQNMQLLGANLMSAALAIHLFSLWHFKMPKLPVEARKHLPFRIVNNMTKTETFKPVS